LVDYQLPPAEMPTQLIAYTTHAFGKLPRTTALPASQDDSALKKIFVLLRAETSHDFSLYKPNTINRRIERRMAVHQIETIDGYVKYLQQTPVEVEALFRDLLIGVTNFFRDPETFNILEQQIIPKLFEGKQSGDVIRVWCTGCSTGEEAYSIAILLQERMEALKQSYTVQVFATDIDSRAIATARAGLYPPSIAADLTPERLARFFNDESNGSAYRIRKGIRDMLVFSEQDLIKDPPFSKLDLISCRNLMIYLGTELQKKLIPLFHYALKPQGFLFLGTSEGIGDFAELFTVIDRKSKIYQRKEDFHNISRDSLGRYLPPMTAVSAAGPRGTPKTAFPVKRHLREITEQALLQQIAPSSALVNAKGDILYLQGRTGMYLELTPGESGINNILKMAREGLRRDLTLALHRAAGSKTVVRYPGLNVKTNGHFTRVNLTVSPLAADTENASDSDLYLVILEEAPPELLPRVPLAATPDSASAAQASDSASQIAALKQELRAKDEYLQTTHEELESSNEELKSANEEMQSVNEELQSTNEELETSKEELQSVNEELATVNVELQTKVVDLSRANNDMNNLLSGTGVGTLFVDHQLRILRFTPAVTAIINLILSDLGRPVAHIVPNLVGYTTLVADIQAVLNTLIPKELEVQTPDEKRYLMRIQPYRTLDNVIEGAVISFLDITEMFHVREALHKANDLLRLAVVVRDAHDAITVQDLEGRILAWNPGAVRLYGWSEAEALLMNVHDRIPENLRAGALTKLVQLGQAEILEPYRAQRIAKNGKVVDVSIISTALLNEAGQLYAVATTERVVGGKENDSA
ncbi:MAG: CheR family methyltransferase, partial [Betaproteobacteria bacterium]